MAPMRKNTTWDTSASESASEALSSAGPGAPAARTVQVATAVSSATPDLLSANASSATMAQ